MSLRGGTGASIVIRGDARHLPLPDASVDLIVTSPPLSVLLAALLHRRRFALQRADRHRAHPEAVRRVADRMHPGLDACPEAQRIPVREPGGHVVIGARGP